MARERDGGWNPVQPGATSLLRRLSVKSPRITLRRAPNVTSEMGFSKTGARMIPVVHEQRSRKHWTSTAIAFSLKVEGVSPRHIALHQLIKTFGAFERDTIWRLIVNGLPISSCMIGPAWVSSGCESRGCGTQVRPSSDLAEESCTTGRWCKLGSQPSRAVATQSVKVTLAKPAHLRSRDAIRQAIWRNKDE
jgi:hypothetical protein